MTGLVCVQRQLNCVINKTARPRKRGKAYVATKSVKVKSSSLLPFSVLAKNTKKGGNAIEEKTNQSQSNNRRRAGHLQVERERTKGVLRFNAHADFG